MLCVLDAETPVQVSCVIVASFWSYRAPYYLTVGILFEFGILINYIAFWYFVVFLVIGVILPCFVVGLLLCSILRTV